MMTFRQRLLERREAIARSWLKGAMAIYPGDSASVFEREKDPFANPVGHSLRQGTESILGALLDGADIGEIGEKLTGIMRIRAVQQVAASEAVGFVPRLKDVVRAELGGVATDPKFTKELAALDARIDEITLAAFDSYMACREAVFELRVNEVKRQVPWVVGKVNREGTGPELVQIGPKPESKGLR